MTRHAPVRDRLPAALTAAGVVLATGSPPARGADGSDQRPRRVRSLHATARIYLGRMETFPGGAPVVPINQAPDSPSRLFLESELLHGSPAQMKSYWTKLMFTGEGKPPEEVASPEEAIARVASDREAIGYADPSEVTGDVKVLTVE